MLTSVVTQAPVPAPPRTPVTVIVTASGASQKFPVTTINQNRHELLLDILNADTKQGGNPVYDEHFTLL